jgi:hypothetical protein
VRDLRVRASALETGLRLLLMSAVTLPAAIASGRLGSRVPTRLLVGVGLGLSGLGLLLMAGLNAGPSWTHLIPGLLLAGVGTGLVNPALAGTAVGVVEHRAAGMASGMNTTFRQVGVATGIAIFGPLFATRTTDSIVAGLRGTLPAREAGQVAAGVVQGQGGNAFAVLPPAVRQVAAHTAKAAFASGLNEILIVSGIGALVAAAAAAAMIRRRDFIGHGQPQPAAPAAAAEISPQPEPVAAGREG